MIGSLLVLAKEPVPGRVKTRLVPPFTYEGAAALAAASLADVLDSLTGVPASEHVLVLAGRRGPWLPDGWRVREQGGGGLDERLTAAFLGARRRPAVLVGMDTPQVRPEHLTGFDPSRFDACIGPATDGGYWAIGFRDPRVAAEAVPGVPMSTPDTFAEQLYRLRRLGLRVQLLDELTDVDTAESAAVVASLAGHGRFAATLRSAAAGAETLSVG